MSGYRRFGSTLVSLTMGLANLTGCTTGARSVDAAAIAGPEALPESCSTAVAATPAEVAVAVRFLACPEASYITGSVLKIDGGIF